MLIYAVDEKVDFIEVYATSMSSTIAFIKSLFDSEAINYYIDNENASAIGVGRVSGEMKVMVAKSQVALAKDLLKGIEE